MTDHIHINTDFGRVVYEAYIGEFAASINDEPTWDELNENTREAWEDIYYTIIENRVVLPRDGVEVMFRTNSGAFVFAWSGLPDAAMKDELISTLFLHMTGQQQ